MKKNEENERKCENRRNFKNRFFRVVPNFPFQTKDSRVPKKHDFSASLPARFSQKKLVSPAVMFWVFTKIYGTKSPTRKNTDFKKGSRKYGSSKIPKRNLQVEQKKREKTRFLLFLACFCDFRVFWRKNKIFKNKFFLKKCRKVSKMACFCCFGSLLSIFGKVPFLIQGVFHQKWIIFMIFLLQKNIFLTEKWVKIAYFCSKWVKTLILVQTRQAQKYSPFLIEKVWKGLIFVSEIAKRGQNRHFWATFAKNEKTPILFLSLFY